MSMISSLSFVGYRVEMLDLLSVVAILFGIYIIISKNPIVSVLFLIGLFVSIACYLIFTGITFIGLAYLLIYVGAVSILFLFIVMLINVRVSELLIENLNSIPLAILLGYFFFYFVKNASQDNEKEEDREDHLDNSASKPNSFNKLVGISFVSSTE
jgi:NADH-ubiquinone oxidoreductase chain 6